MFIETAKNYLTKLEKQVLLPVDVVWSRNMELTREMDLNVADYNLVHFSLISGYGSLVHLAAKLADEIFSVWIKPADPIPMLPKLEDLGYEWRTFELYLRNKKVPTVSADSALRMFNAFLQSSPRPVILVCHSSDAETICLLRIIQTTDSAQLFRGTIAGFVDTLPIFRKIFRQRKQLNQFRLRSLSEDLLGENFTGAADDLTYFLDIEQKLTARFVSPSNYAGNITPYEEAVTTEWIDEA